MDHLYQKSPLRTLLLTSILLAFFSVLPGIQNLALAQSGMGHHTYPPTDQFSIAPDSSSKQYYHIPKSEVMKPEEVNRNFYLKLKNNWSKSWIGKGIMDAFITIPAAKKIVSDKQSTERFSEYEGKTISKITIKKVGVFMEDVDDTTKIATDKWIKTYNKSHINTVNWNIKTNLIVQEGDQVDKEVIADNERILRSLSYIRDARFMMKPDPMDSTQVHLVVVTQDIMPLEVGLNPQGFDRGNFTLGHRNMLGTGIRLRNTVYLEQEFREATSDTEAIQRGHWGYSAAMAIQNIRRSFIDVNLDFRKTFTQDRLAFNAYRGYVTPENNYAGGTSLEYQRHNANIYVKSKEAFENIDYNFVSHDYWISKAFRFPCRNPTDRKRLIAGARYAQIQYFMRPEVNDTLNFGFHNQDAIFFNFGYSNRNYYTDKFLYEFGRNEDIPFGMSIEVIGGKEFGEFNHRHYLGFKYAHGRPFKKLGYLRWNFELGQYFGPQYYNEGVLRMGTQFFSKLINKDGLRMRQFLTVEYVSGLNRRPDDQLILNDEELRGFRTNTVGEQEQFIIKLETIKYTNFQPFGFRMAFYAFADMAVISQQNSQPFKGDFYGAFGAGIRMRNDHFTFKTLQIRLVYYPKTPAGLPNFNLHMDNRISEPFRDYRVEKPSIVRFNERFIQ